MNQPTPFRWLSLAFFSFAVLLCGCQRQAHYPSRPLMLICPWAAGGGTDRISRQIAMQLEDELGVPVNVVNATGGGGVTGHTRGALAEPDGYTLTMITPELNMLHWRGLTEIDYQDFDPLMMVNRDAAALFVRTDAKWKNLRELTADIRKNPGEFKASGTAFGGIWHLSLAGWLTEEKIDPATVTWVSINGSNPSLQELLAGGVDMVCCSVPEAQSLLDGKKIRCLGIMAPERQEGMKDIPTFEEQGVHWSHLGWRGLALPKGVPGERREELLAAIRRVVTSKEYRQYLDRANFGYAAEPPEKFVAFLKKDDDYYGKMLTSPAFKAVQKVQFGPMYFPTLLAGLMFVSVLLLDLTKKGSAAEATQTPTRAGIVRMFLVIASVILFLAVVEWAGFIVTGIIMLALLLLLLRVRWYVALLVPLVLIPAVYHVFAVVLRVPLPWGFFGW